MCSQLLWCEAATNQQRALMAKKWKKKKETKKVSAGDIRWMKQKGKGENYI